MANNYVDLILANLPSYSYSVSLEGNSYVLEFNYNERMKLYCMSILTAENIPVVEGVAVVPNYPITLDYNIPELTGYFWLTEIATIISEPYKEFPENINEYYTYQYIYVTTDEI